MQKCLPQFMVLLVVAGLCGCETVPVQTRITSEPPGARIEVNGNVVGEAPVTVTLRQTQNHHKVKGLTTIQAYPVQEGQFVQTKTLQKVLVPEHVHFDMRLQPLSVGLPAIVKPAETNAPATSQPPQPK